MCLPVLVASFWSDGQLKRRKGSRNGKSALKRGRRRLQDATLGSLMIPRSSKRRGILPHRVHRVTMYPIEIRASLFVAQKGRCPDCKRRLPIDAFQVDHVLPQSKDGPDHITNYALRCGPCNKVKGARIIPCQQTNLFSGVMRTRVTGAEHMRRARIRARALGRCGVCTTGTPEAGLRNCRRCIDGGSERSKKSWARRAKTLANGSH